MAMADMKGESRREKVEGKRSFLELPTDGSEDGQKFRRFAVEIDDCGRSIDARLLKKLDPVLRLPAPPVLPFGLLGRLSRSTRLGRFLLNDADLVREISP